MEQTLQRKETAIKLMDAALLEKDTLIQDKQTALELQKLQHENFTNVARMQTEHLEQELNEARDIMEKMDDEVNVLREKLIMKQSDSETKKETVSEKNLSMVDNLKTEESKENVEDSVAEETRGSQESKEADQQKLHELVKTMHSLSLDIGQSHNDAKTKQVEELTAKLNASESENESLRKMMK